LLSILRPNGHGRKARLRSDAKVIFEEKKKVKSTIDKDSKKVKKTISGLKSPRFLHKTQENHRRENSNTTPQGRCPTARCTPTQRRRIRTLIC